MTEHGICAKCKKSVGCPYANGRITGCKNFVLEPELKLTRKEWLRQCNTEQLADIFMRFMFDADFKTRFVSGNFYDEFAEWLKEKHNG